MSVYSRWVDARGTTTIVSMPALRHGSKPVFSSRLGSGAWVGEPGEGVSDEPAARKYGFTEKPYSDWMPSDGTTGLTSSPLSGPEPPFEGPVSLSSAIAVCTRGSVPWTFDTAAAPSEWPMIAIRVVRPGVTVFLSFERSHSFQNGLNLLTSTSPDAGLLYGASGRETKKSSASTVPFVKFASCWNGTPGQPVCSSCAGVANGLQNGRAFVGWGRVSLVPWPWTS